MAAGIARAQAASKSAVLVIDPNTGRVLHASAADELRHPASLAKMMTIYMAFELIERGQLSYQTKLKISANAAETAPTKLDLAEGEEIALIDAIKALITKSANDMAVAIAEHIAGSEERFAKLMTQKARQLGMPATIFRNASGLPDVEQVTTARDMVTLALRLQDDFPKHYPLFATRTFTYNDETLQNHNTLLSSYEGTDGIKTGYTRASGFNLVASVRRGGKHVVGAIFGGASAASRNAAMRTFLNMGLVRASTEKTRQPAPLLVAQARPAQERKNGQVPTPRRIERPAGQIEAAPPAEPTAVQQTPGGAEFARHRDRPCAYSPRVAAPAPIRRPIRRAAPAAPRWTTASAGQATPPGAPAERPMLLSGSATAVGAPPSTLEAQAANLSRDGAPVAAPPRPHPRPAPAPADLQHRRRPPLLRRASSISRSGPIKARPRPTAARLGARAGTGGIWQSCSRDDPGQAGRQVVFPRPLRRLRGQDRCQRLHRAQAPEDRLSRHEGRVTPSLLRPALR